MIVVATTIHNVPTCKATWITWPTNNSSQAAVFFRSKPMSPFQRAPVEATNDLYGIEPPLSPATLHFVYGSHWALCTGLLGGFFLMATSVGGPVLSVNSMVAMILRCCMYCWFLDLIFGWFVDGLLQSLKFIYSCFIHGLQIIQVMPSFDFGKIFSVDIFKDPKFHRVHSYIYTHLFEFADIYKLCVYTYSYTLYRSDRKILSSCLEAFFGQQNVPLGCSNLWKNAVLLPWHLPQVQLLFVSSVEDSGRTVWWCNAW